MNKEFVTPKGAKFESMSAFIRHSLATKNLKKEDGTLDSDKVLKIAKVYGISASRFHSTYNHDTKKGINDIDPKTGSRKKTSNKVSEKK